MTLIKTLWASVQGDPSFMRKVNGYLTIFWLLMIPVSIATKWIHSVAYISALSLWALVSGHWSAWQAARVEVAQQQEAQQREDHPLEEKVVEELVQRTNIESAPTAPLPARTSAKSAANTTNTTNTTNGAATNGTATNSEIEAMIRRLCDQVDQLRRQLPVAQPAASAR